MTARVALPIVSVVLAVGLATGCGVSFYEVPIETPLQAKLDVSAFSRVLVAGFVAGGSDDVETNIETVRLLRSQLRTRSKLRVIEADVLPLAEIVRTHALETGEDGNAPTTSNEPAPGAETQLPERIRDEKTLANYERIFADVAYWKKLGEEFQNPLIVTGTILFVPHQRNAIVTREQEVFDQLGRRRVIPVRTYMERKGFILRPKFVFIDGRTGATLYSESFREEVLYNAQTNTPALSSYFELMDRLVPTFLSTLSSQKIRGTRVLLK